MYRTQSQSMSAMVHKGINLTGSPGHKYTHTDRLPNFEVIHV